MLLHTFKMNDQTENMTARKKKKDAGKCGRGGNELLVWKIMTEMQMRENVPS